MERITVTPNPTTTFGSVDSDFGFTTLIEAATTPYVFSDYVEVEILNASGTGITFTL